MGEAKRHDKIVINGKPWPGALHLDSNVRIVDKGRRQRRQNARAGTRGRRGARSVDPCPMYLCEVRQKLDPETVRQVRDAIENWSRNPPNCIVLPGEWPLEVIEPRV